MQHQLYGRYDVPLGRSTRLLLNPALFVQHGRSPNGENPGSFIALVQGVGLLIEEERVSFTPAVALVAGRAARNSYGHQYGPTATVFGTASLGITAVSTALRACARRMPDMARIAETSMAPRRQEEL